MIILISFNGCKSDKNSFDETLSRADQYFNDYESPEYLWGYIDPSGTAVIPPKFDDLRDFNNGQAAVSYRGKWGIINTSGDYIIPPIYLDIHQFNDDLCLVEDFNNTKYYIDLQGNKAFDCPYDECYTFSNGLARVVGQDVTSYLNSKGEAIDGMNFSGGSDFKSGHAVIRLGSRYGVINIKGDKIIPTEYDKISINENIATCKKNGTYTFYNLASKSPIKGNYDKASIFEDGYSVVKSDQEYGLVDSKGSFTSIGPGKIRYLNEGRWSQKQENGYSIIDEKGVSINDSIYTNVFKFNCGVAGFSKGEAWSYVTKNGSELFAAQLPIIWDCSEDYIRFISNRGFGFMDHTSSIKIAPQYIEARDFKEGFARVQFFE